MIRPGQQNGFILMPVVLAIALIATLAFLLNNQSTINIDITTAETEAKQVGYVTTAGMQHARWQLQQLGCGPFSDLSSQTFGNHSYSATITPNTSTSTTSYTVSVTDDAWINDATPTQNYGSDAQLSAYKTVFPSSTRRALYRFDIAGAGIPAGTTVASAVAKIFVTNTNETGPVTVHQVIADWSEATVNWDNMNTSYDSSSIATIPANPPIGQYVLVNITPLVQVWVNGSSVNQGIMLLSDIFLDTATFSSKEYANASQRPLLEITTTSSTPPNRADISVTGTLASGISQTLSRSEVPLYQSANSSSIQLQAGSGKDAMLSDFYSSRNYGDFKLRVTSEAASSPRNSLVQFDIATVPVGARVLSAQLQLYHSVKETTGVDAVVSVHRVNRDWVEGTQSGSGTADGATWDDWDSGNAWGTAGGDYDPAAISSSLITDAIGDWETWDIKTLVQGWLDGTFANNGLLLKGSGKVGASFASKEDVDPTLHPKLDITYSCECGIACIPPQGSGKIALIGDDSSPDPDDQLKIEIIESWGYEVDFYQDLDSASINWSLYDLAYVSETVISGDVSANLANVSIGVVNEEPKLYDNLLLANGDTGHVGSSIDIIDNSHYITSIFPSGPLSIYGYDMEILTADTPLAAGLQTLGEYSGASSLTATDQGAATTSGSAAGRRVTLPLGQHFASGFNWRHLNNNGSLMVQRAIQWGTGNTGTVPTGPTAHWKLDETAGTIAVDSVGGHDGTLVGNPTWSTGNHVGALDFDGVGDRIDVGPILDAGAPQISIVAWVFKRDTGDDRVISKSSGGAIVDHIFSLGVAGTTIRARLRTTDNGGTSDYDGGTISLNQWVHLAFTYDGGMLRIYMDGTETASYGVTGDMIASTLDVAIGNLNATDDRYWNGLLDDVRIYDYMLTGTEIADLAVMPATTPLAHWKLDETSGVIAVDSVGGHDGTLNSSPVWSVGQLDGALNFDGIDDAIRVPHADTLSLTDTMTFIAWVNASSYGGSYQTIVAKDASGTGSNYYFGAWQQELVFGFFSGGFFREVLTSGLNLQTATWYQLAASFDNATDEVRLYVDGAQVHSGTLAYSPTVVTADLSIGRSPDGEYWPGLLDDVRLYDSVLPAGEIADLYTVGGGGGGGTPPPASVVYEEFTEAADSNDVTSLAIDKPAGTVAGDLLIAAVATDGNNTSSLVPPAGWNVIHVADSAGNVTFGVWWKIAGASESSSYTFSWSNSEQSYGWIMRFTGFDPSSPVNVISNDVGASDTPPSPFVVTTVANTLILRLGGFDEDKVTVGDPGLSGHTAINMDSSNGGKSGASGGSAYLLQSVAGDSGVSSFTLTKSQEYVTVTIAITPAP